MPDAVMTRLTEEFITLWAIIDPIGTLPVFMAVTAGLTPAHQRAVAFKAFAAATSILLGFIVLGQFVLDGLEISLIAFQISGGIILFLFAVSMIFGKSKPESELSAADPSDSAIFPVAVPSLAGPGAMLTVVLLTDNNRYSVAQQAMTAGLMIAIMSIALAVMLAAPVLSRVIRNSGASVISRVMGIVLAAVAVDNVMEALTSIGVLPEV